MKPKKIICLVCTLALCLSLCTPVWADSSGLSGAHSLSNIGTAQGTLTIDDRVDYYRYTVSPGSSVELKIKFTSDIHYTAFRVLDADGKKYSQFYWSLTGSTGQRTDNVSILLNPGTYYFEIYGDMGSTGSYTMSYTTDLLHNTDSTWDDTLTSAQALPLTADVTGLLSEFCGDKVDLYRLKMDKAGILKYSLKFYMKNLKLKLLDEDGNMMQSWYFTWNSNLQMGTETFEIPLEPGTYYLQFEREYNDGKYTFTQKYTDTGSTEVEPNNTLEQAQPLTLGKRVSAILAMGKDTDFYTFIVPTARNITFSVPSKVKNLNLYVYDAEGKEVKRAYTTWNSNTGAGTLKRIYKLSAGKYYVQIKGDYYFGTYNLTVSSTSTPSKGSITSIKRTTKTATGKRYINLKFAASTYAEGYQIYVSSNSRFSGADKYTTKNRTFKTAPYKTGKTYYVKVRAYRQNSDGEYIYGKFSTVKKIKL